ncbi:SAP domain-containing protein [Mucilaginibacter oryzae]
MEKNSHRRRRLQCTGKKNELITRILKTYEVI